MGQVFPAAGFVLVGGQSQRMGQDKGLLELAGKPLFLRMVDLLRPCVAEVTLLGPPEHFAGFGLPVLPDGQPGRGPLEALCTGLASSPYEWNLFLACDLPLLEKGFLEFLLRRALATTKEAVVPYTSQRWQPLAAAYHRRCLPAMQQILERGHAGIVDLLPTLRVEVLETEELAGFGFPEAMFLNVNSPSNWEEVKRRWELRRQ